MNCYFSEQMPLYNVSESSAHQGALCESIQVICQALKDFMEEFNWQRRWGHDILPQNVGTSKKWILYRRV